MQSDKLSCVDCHVVACDTEGEKYPEFCISKGIPKEIKQKVKEMYINDAENKEIFTASAEIEGNYYCELSRVEETILFLRKIKAKKVGIVSCVGTLQEARFFANILRKKDFEVISAGCKIGSYDKSEALIKEKDKVCPNEFEPYCNPIMQALYMNENNVDFVVMVGLCVGHDTLFYKYCDRPITVLFTKDRVTGHNAVSTLYNSTSYYKNKLNNL